MLDNAFSIESRNPTMRKSHLSNTFKPQTKKATQNRKTQGGKSQLSKGQKSQLNFFLSNRRPKKPKTSENQLRKNTTSEKT